jgi:hypothetical protein
MPSTRPAPACVQAVRDDDDDDDDDDSRDVVRPRALQHPQQAKQMARRATIGTARKNMAMASGKLSASNWVHTKGGVRRAAAINPSVREVTVVQLVVTAADVIIGGAVGPDETAAVT